MTIVVQNSEGTAVDETTTPPTKANSYVSIAEATQILTDMGRTPSTALTEGNLITARVYLDTYRNYDGKRLTRDQITAFPRKDLCDSDGYDVEGIPFIVKQAQSLLALEAQSGSLYVNQRVTAGQAAGTYTRREKLGPLEQEFAESSGIASSVTESRFNEVDALLDQFTDEDNLVVV